MVVEHAGPGYGKAAFVVRATTSWPCFWPLTVIDLRPGSVRTDMMKGDGHFRIATPERAAREILKAVESKRKIAYITPRWRFIGRLLHLMPGAVHRRMMKRSEKRESK